MANTRFPMGANGRRKARRGRRWLYMICGGIFCFGLVALAAAGGEDRSAAQAYVVTADGASRPADLPPTVQGTDSILRQRFMIGAAMMLGTMLGAGRTLSGEGRGSRKPKPASAGMLPVPRIKTNWFAETLRMKPRLDAACCEVLDQPQSDFSQTIEQLLDRATDVESRGAIKILFVSNQDGLGGTTIAVNFAQMAAQADYRVLLIEANRRHPILASMISPDVEVDLIDLSGTRRIVCHLRPGLSALPLFDEETSDMLEARASQCIKGISGRFDLVVIDGGTYDQDDKETLNLVDAVNRVFRLNPEGIDLQASRNSMGSSSLGRRR